MWCILLIIVKLKLGLWSNALLYLVAVIDPAGLLLLYNRWRGARTVLRLGYGEVFEHRHEKQTWDHGKQGLVGMYRSQGRIPKKRFDSRWVGVIGYVRLGLEVV